MNLCQCLPLLAAIAALDHGRTPASIRNHKPHAEAPRSAHAGAFRGRCCPFTLAYAQTVRRPEAEAFERLTVNWDAPRRELTEPQEPRTIPAK